MIPDGVTKIASGAFNRCELLTSVTIPEGVTTIGDYAFEKCELLSSMTLPSSLEELGTSGAYSCVFMNCTKLKQIFVSKDCATKFEDLRGCHKFVVINAGQRVVCHYDTIEGRVGQELVKPNGDHYFDVDWFDFDTAPVQGYGDGELTGYSGSIPGVDDPLSAYKQNVEEDPSNKDGKDSPSWYHPSASWNGSQWLDKNNCEIYSGGYHPFVTTPTKAGTYNLTLTFSWDDGYTETINIRFIIREKGAWYVDGASGSDANSGLEASSAKATIQAAIDVALACDTILVAPGTYDAINTQGKNVTIRSTGGAEQTKIVGRTSGGVNDDGEVTAAMLISDTLNGQIGDSSDPDYEDEQTTYKYDIVNEWKTWTPADLACSTLEGFSIEVNSVSEDDQVGIVGGNLKNCRLICADGVKRFNLVQLAVIENSFIQAGDLGVWIDEDGNEDGNVEAFSDCILRNCTVYTGSMICSSKMENTIVYARNTKVSLDEGTNKPTLSNCVFYNVNGVSGRSGVTVADPMFKDVANGDFRIRKASPCVDAGGTVYGTTDLAGSPRVVNGKIDVGCYEYQNDEPDVPTVSASAANVVATYDGTAHGIAVSVSEPTSGVTVEYALSADGPWQSESFSFTEVCAATQVWYRALAEGYLGVTNKATVTVNARSIQDVTVSVTLPDGGYKYDGTAKEPAVSVTDSFSGFSSSDYSVSYSDNVNAGTAKVVVTGAGSHYTGTKETTFAIAPRTLTFTSASAEWAWDGAAHSCETAPTVTGDGFVGEDGATFSGFASVTAPGTYENTFSYAFTSGTVASNYSVSQVYGKLRVFNYKASVKDDGTVKIDGLGDEPLGSTEIAIPEKIDGKPVTEIAEGAFANSTCGATSLTLAKYCKKIGASAFRGIGTLKTVTFVKVYETDDVTEAKLEIGANAFNSTGIASLSVPDYVQEIGNYAFANCGDLKRVAIPAGTTVSTKAFYRSGITAGAKPEVITFSAFTVSGSVATMKVTGTGGSINVSGLAVYFSSSLGARAEWSKIDHSVGETVLTNTGCEVTVAVNVPTGAEGAYFYVELAN